MKSGVCARAGEFGRGDAASGGEIFYLRLEDYL